MFYDILVSLCLVYAMGEKVGIAGCYTRFPTNSTETWEIQTKYLFPYPHPL